MHRRALIEKYAVTDKKMVDVIVIWEMLFPDTIVTKGDVVHMTEKYRCECLSVAAVGLMHAGKSQNGQVLSVCREGSLEGMGQSLNQRINLPLPSSLPPSPSPSLSSPQNTCVFISSPKNLVFELCLLSVSICVSGIKCHELFIILIPQSSFKALGIELDPQVCIMAQVCYLIKMVNMYVLQLLYLGNGDKHPTYPLGLLIRIEWHFINGRTL